METQERRQLPEETPFSTDAVQLLSRWICRHSPPKGKTESPKPQGTKLTLRNPTLAEPPPLPLRPTEESLGLSARNSAQQGGAQAGEAAAHSASEPVSPTHPEPVRCLPSREEGSAPHSGSPVLPLSLPALRAAQALLFFSQLQWCSPQSSRKALERGPGWGEGRRRPGETPPQTLLQRAAAASVAAAVQNL